MLSADRMQSIRVTAYVAVLLAGADATGRADVYVNGTFTGTFYNNGVNPPIDTLGIFSSPGTDLTNQAITGSFTCDASALPLTEAGAGCTELPGAYNPYTAEELPFTGTLDVTATPEPALFPALCPGFVGLGIVRARRRRAVS